MSSKVYDSMPECDHVLSFFLFKSYSALFPLLSAHGLKFEVGGYLCLLTKISYSLPSPSFAVFYFTCSIFLSPHGVRILAFVFGLHWRMAEELI